MGSLDDIFSILEDFENVSDQFPALEEQSARLASQRSTSPGVLQELSETEAEVSPDSNKRRRLITSTITSSASLEEGIVDGQQRMSHITVERNRRKQMNEHLSVLRSLMPCFYVKRGDQASIIGGVVDYINELQQVLQSLEAKKQRKVYSDVLSPRVAVSSPRPPLPIFSSSSPRMPPLSPRLLSVPASPRTPQPTRPYRPLPPPPPQPRSSAAPEPPPPTPTTASSSSDLVANTKSAVADVEVKFSGANVLLKTVSARIPGQAVKIVSALEELSLEILHVTVSTVDETMLNSFTIKIGIECRLSAEELAQRVHETFC